MKNLINNLDTSAKRYFAPSLAEQYLDALKEMGLDVVYNEEGKATIIYAGMDKWFNRKAGESDSSFEEVAEVIEIDGKLIEVKVKEYKQPGVESQYLDTLKSRKSLSDMIVGQKPVFKNPYEKVNGGLN